MRIRKSADLAARIGIRNRKEMAFADFAPTANIFLSQLNEIDRSLVLVFPFNRKYFPLVSIDLHDGARPD